jgi:15-cis-phytoene synthase
MTRTISPLLDSALAPQDNKGVFLDASQREAAFQTCAHTVRRLDPDRYFATLFVPQPQREALFALYAFNAEIARIRDVISDPMPGEIRLQWWRDAIMGEARGDVQSHPIAGALLEVMSHYHLPPQAFLAILDARTFDLYDDPMPTLHDLEGYCGETCSLLMQLACLILGGNASSHTADVAGHAGVAYALTGVLRNFLLHCARGQMYLPIDVLARYGLTPQDVFSRMQPQALAQVFQELRGLAKEHLAFAQKALAHLDSEQRAAFLPLALVEPALERLEKNSARPYDALPERAQWRKQWTLWRASRNV